MKALLILNGPNLSDLGEGGGSSKNGLGCLPGNKAESSLNRPQQIYYQGKIHAPVGSFSAC